LSPNIETERAVLGPTMQLLCAGPRPIHSGSLDRNEACRPDGPSCSDRPGRMNWQDPSDCGRRRREGEPWSSIPLQPNTNARPVADAIASPNRTNGPLQRGCVCRFPPINNRIGQHGRAGVLGALYVINPLYIARLGKSVGSCCFRSRRVGHHRAGYCVPAESAPNGSHERSLFRRIAGRCRPKAPPPSVRFASLGRGLLGRIVGPATPIASSARQ